MELRIAQRYPSKRWSVSCRSIRGTFVPNPDFIGPEWESRTGAVLAAKVALRFLSATIVKNKHGWTVWAD